MRTTSRIRFGEGQVIQCRVELEGVAPPLWRRLLVSERASLHELHVVIEHALGREGDGEYHFDVDGIRFDDPMVVSHAGRSADQIALVDLGLHPGARITHRAETHDQPWVHVLTVEQVTPRLVGQRLPACTAGGRAAPPDVCAGPRAYREFLDALTDPFDPRSAEWRDWLPDEFDPEFADMRAINASLARVPKRRPAA